MWLRLQVWLVTDLEFQADLQKGLGEGAQWLQWKLCPWIDGRPADEKISLHQLRKDFLVMGRNPSWVLKAKRWAWGGKPELERWWWWRAVIGHVGPETAVREISAPADFVQGRWKLAECDGWGGGRWELEATISCDMNW
jgi:hypothetical protein